MTGLKKISVLTAAVGLLLCSAALAQDYEIRLHRPVKVGQEFQVSATGRASQKTTVSMGGEVLKSDSEDMAIEVEATVKVLEVDKNGIPSKESLKIGKCVEVQGEKRTPLAPAGAEVVASIKDNKHFFEIDGQKASPQAEKALAQVVTLGKNGPTADQGFGTSERKKAGDRWAMNSDVAAQDALQNGVDIKKEDITGTVTLEKVVKVGDTECLQVAVTMNVAKIVPPWLPPGFAVEKGTLQRQVTAKLPVNTALNLAEMSDNLSSSFVLKGRPQPDAPEMVIETVATRQTTTRCTYPKN